DCDDMLALLSEISAQTWTYRDIRAVRLRNDRWNNPRLVSVTFRGE
ncbi:MAG: hypothetical protein JO125_02930, partial [Chloroflexi bacterium]|nr:hypothetical protein [Chloroflexota bacterium]